MNFKLIYTSSKWYLDIRNVLMFTEYFTAINFTEQHSLSFFIFLIVLSLSGGLPEGRCPVCHADYCIPVSRTIPSAHQALDTCLLVFLQ